MMTIKIIPKPWNRVTAIASNNSFVLAVSSQSVRDTLNKENDPSDFDIFIHELL